MAVRGCAVEVAIAHGEYPQLAASRMRWARRKVTSLYQQHGVAPQVRRPASRQPHRVAANGIDEVCPQLLPWIRCSIGGGPAA